MRELRRKYTELVVLRARVRSTASKGVIRRLDKKVAEALVEVLNYQGR
jgi:hypothetical protein